MKSDGFPRPVAVALGIALATAVSLLVGPSRSLATLCPEQSAISRE